MTPTNRNTLLYVDENLSFGFQQEEAPLLEPEDGELLIETLFSGINPADGKHATLLGIYPATLGYDFCGKVLRAPLGSKFSSGDIVAGYTPTGVDRPKRFGTHQSYLSCPEEMAFLVPPNLPYDHAACLSVVTMTAADTLYNLYKLPLPSASPEKFPKPILIWGASSSVGICTVQLARASGVHPIFVTASPGRHHLLYELGATRCFDYKSKTVVLEIKEALAGFQSETLAYAFDAVGSHGTLDSGKLVADCSSSEQTNMVSVVLQSDPRFKMPFATPNRDVTLRVKGVPHPITIPARRDDYNHQWKAFQWAIENYGTLFRLPLVEVFSGSAGEALKEVMTLAEEGRGFGKLVLKHPLSFSESECS
ncbi:alcohol dehydrogenase [Penicillium verhagenii]|nr:alcohol dehydrogenase [Penicillium verhagenii]